MDFKGWFLLGDGQRCDPLTVCDLKTHFIIGCRAMPNQQYGGTYRQFKALMRHNGLPEAIRVDNGTRFGRIGRSIQAERLVDIAGNPRRVHASGLPSGQRFPRTLA